MNLKQQIYNIYKYKKNNINMMQNKKNQILNQIRELRRSAVNIKQFCHLNIQT